MNTDDRATMIFCAIFPTILAEQKEHSREINESMAEAKKWAIQEAWGVAWDAACSPMAPEYDGTEE